MEARDTMHTGTGYDAHGYGIRCTRVRDTMHTGTGYDAHPHQSGDDKNTYISVAWKHFFTHYGVH